MDQPLLIYGDYAKDAIVTLANAAANQIGADVLQANEDTYVSPADTTLTITIDLLSPVSCGCIALAGENLNGILLELRGSTDNFSSSNVAVSASSALSGNISAWRPFTPASYRYWRLVITGATTATRIYHVALSPAYLLPFFEDGADLDSFSSTTTQIVSPQGHLLGIQTNKTERKIPLNWGQVDDGEYLPFWAWAMSCVFRPQPFFLVPNSAQSLCIFGYTEANYKFSAPMKNGMRDIATIPFTSRFA